MTSEVFEYGRVDGYTQVGFRFQLNKLVEMNQMLLDHCSELESGA